MKLFAFTLDLESDYAGVVNRYGIFRDSEKIEKLLSLLASLDIKITVFAVGEILDSYPDIIRIFEKYNCEFEPHSHSHNFSRPDSESEISRCREAYFNYFKRYPSGYRAPRGMISEIGIKLLEKHGFKYDSSIIPSYFPNPFKYLLKKRQAHYCDNSGIMEIPFTVVTPFRLTLSVSYIKLLGDDFFKKASLPDTVCFGSHLHDFICDADSFSSLPILWKFIYSVNKFKGIDYCVEFLKDVKLKGYRFCYMSEIFDKYKNNLL